MSALPLSTDHFDSDIFDYIAQAIEQKGYIILPNALPQSLVDSLFIHLQSQSGDTFTEAGVGRELQYQRNHFVRKDEIRWLSSQFAPEQAYLRWMEDLRVGLNRRLFLGLFDYEAHFAHYPKGAFYKRHLDAFKGQTNRILTTVFYLNPHWSHTDGGELVIYPEKDATEILEKVPPCYGTLVVFLSEDFPHEVLVTARDRYSIAGWFRVNTSIGNQIDPPK